MHAWVFVGLMPPCFVAVAGVGQASSLMYVYVLVCGVSRIDGVARYDFRLIIHRLLSSVKFKMGR